MIQDNSRIPKLSEGNVLQNKTMNDPFVARSQAARKKKGNSFMRNGQNQGVRKSRKTKISKKNWKLRYNGLQLTKRIQQKLKP